MLAAITAPVLTPPTGSCAEKIEPSSRQITAGIENVSLRHGVQHKVRRPSGEQLGLQIGGNSSQQ